MNISFNETREISVPALKVFQASKHKDIVKVNQLNRAEVTIVNRVNPRKKNILGVVIGWLVIGGW